MQEQLIKELSKVILHENEKLRQEIKQTISEENQKLRNEFKQDNEKLRNEFKQETEKLRNEFKQETEKLKNEFKKDFNNLHEEMVARFFVFETDFGKKIDILYDYVMLQKDIFGEKFENLRKLDKRVEICEIRNLDHEKRISILERKA